MPTIPKFAVALAKLAKSNPKIIQNSSTQITNKRKRKTHNKITNQHTKRIKSDTKPLEKEKIIKPINQSLSKKIKGKKSITNSNEINGKLDKKVEPKADTTNKTSSKKKRSKENNLNTKTLINKIYNAYHRNLKRVEQVNPDFKLEKIPLKGSFRYLLQQIAAYNGTISGENDTLCTPFGVATVKYENGTDGMLDKHIIDPTPTKYEEICKSIDNVLKSEDKFNKFYDIILNYLKTPADDKYAGRKLSNITVEENNFFKIENFKNTDEFKVKIAKNAATSLCAIFMVSESSANRLFEGGKVSRALFGHDKQDTVSKKLNLFPPSIQGGAKVSRNVRGSEKSLGPEWYYLNDKLSDDSKDESFDSEKAKEELAEEIKSKIDDFLKAASISDLTAVKSIMDHTNNK